jgi:hypothetical protein
LFCLKPSRVDFWFVCECYWSRAALLLGLVGCGLLQF